jgi:hypothetical protein
MHPKALTAALPLIALLAGAATPAATAEPPTWEQTKAYAHDRKADAVAAAQRLVAATDRQIATLKRQIAQSTGETRAAHERNMAELAVKRRQAQAQLDRMQQSAAQTWDATRQGFVSAFGELQSAVDKAVAGVRGGAASP